MKEREAVAASAKRSSVATSSRPSAAVRVSILNHMLASNRGTIGQGFRGEERVIVRPTVYGSQPPSTYTTPSRVTPVRRPSAWR